MTDLQQIQLQLAELTRTVGEVAEREQQIGASSGVPAPPLMRDRHAREEALIEQIEKAYKELGATRRKLARAESARRRHEQRVRVDNADALMGAKNERVANLYLDGLFDTDQYRKLVDAEKGAELDHFEARAEVDRLQLTVKVLRATARANDPEGGR